MKFEMMKAEISLPELGLIAITRAMLGAGIALLLADRMDSSQRKAVGLTLTAVGVLTTVPLVVDVFGQRVRRDTRAPDQSGPEEAQAVP